MDRGQRSKRRIYAGACKVDVSSRGKFLFSRDTSYNHAVVDVSEVGLQILHGEKLRKGTPLTLSVYHPRTFLPTEVRGKVAWATSTRIKRPSRRYAIGVEFSSMNKRRKTQVIRLMETIRGLLGVRSSGAAN